MDIKGDVFHLHSLEGRRGSIVTLSNAINEYCAFTGSSETEAAFKLAQIFGALADQFPFLSQEICWNTVSWHSDDRDSLEHSPQGVLRAFQADTESIANYFKCRAIGSNDPPVEILFSAPKGFFEYEDCEVEFLIDSNVALSSQGLAALILKVGKPVPVFLLCEPPKQCVLPPLRLNEEKSASQSSDSRDRLTFQHETPELKAMLMATEKFWTSYDRERPPLQKHVRAFIAEHLGISNESRKAVELASAIRPVAER